MIEIPSFDIVIPTIGRPSLSVLLEALQNGRGPLPRRIFIVDDRKDATFPLLPERPWSQLKNCIEVLKGKGAGPAAARNTGWRASTAKWVVFLDDDVIPEPDWAYRLLEDLSRLNPGVAGSQGRLRVPLPQHRRPTDWERNVSGLETANWTTADIAYRRSVLDKVGGFDERFPRAYREDADLSLRITGAGYGIEKGRRLVIHPVRHASPWISVKLQAGNADDVLMLALHGLHWRQVVGVNRGRRLYHLIITASGLVGIVGWLTGHRKLAVLGGALWFGGTAEFSWARIAPGPGTFREVFIIVLTSAIIPAAATFHWLSGLVNLRRLLNDKTRAPHPKTID